MLAVIQVAGALLSVASAVQGDVARSGDDVLDRWLRAWQSGLVVDARATESFVTRLEAGFVATGHDPAARARLRLQAVDVLALLRDASESSPDLLERRTLAHTAAGSLQADTGAWDWLATEVLPVASAHPVQRRLATLDWLLERPRPELATALLVLARRTDDPLRPDALRALARWAALQGAHDSIDQFLVSLLGRGESADSRPHPFGLLQERILTCPTPLGARATVMLRERVEVMLRSSDWRQVSRALHLARGIDLELRVPMLLDALSAWSRRSQLGRGSKRIEGDIVAELQRISGRTIGSNPRNWITWWVAVRQGRVALPGTQGSVDGLPDGDQPDADRSRATFFGLRASTDRVTFVVDHSGSMASGFGTREVTKYEEAIHQMTQFLQAAGPATRFNVILFDSEPLRSSVELVEASAENIERARASSLARSPGGGTHLVPAIELALCLGADGHVDPRQFTADTIIVLCDGETMEGSAWVAPLLLRVLPDSQVRFHCVQIGNQGGTALEELARISGGDFMRVSG